MSFIINEKDTKINRLEYTTFELEDFNSGDEVVESQEIKISAKSGVDKDDNLTKVFLFEVFIQGKSEEILLRELHLDIFYDFSFADQYKENENELFLYMYNYFLKKIENIVAFVSGVDQQYPLSIKDRIDETNQKIKGINLDIKIQTEN